MADRLQHRRSKGPVSTPAARLVELQQEITFLEGMVARLTQENVDLKRVLREATEMTDQIVDYVQIVEDENGSFRVRGKSANGEVVWTTEQYGDKEWALAVALDSGKPLKQEDEGA